MVKERNPRANQGQRRTSTATRTTLPTGSGCLEARVTREQIAVRAYQIWERTGRPSGQALDHWVRAERELCGNG